MVLISLHPGQPVPIGNIILPLDLLVLNPLLLLLLPNQFVLLLQFVKLKLQERNLFVSLGSLEMINLFLLSFKTNLQFLFLFLKSFHLFGHNVVRFQVGNFLFSHPLQNYVSYGTVGELTDLVFPVPVLKHEIFH